MRRGRERPPSWEVRRVTSRNPLVRSLDPVHTVNAPVPNVNFLTEVGWDRAGTQGFAPAEAARINRLHFMRVVRRCVDTAQPFLLPSVLLFRVDTAPAGGTREQGTRELRQAQRRTGPAQVWEFSKNTALLQLERRNQQLMEQLEAFGAERLQHAAAVETAKAAAVDAARGAVQHELSAAEQRAVYLRARMLERSEATVQAATRATRLRTAFHILR